MGILQITHEAAGSASVGVDKHSTVKSIIEESIEGQPGFASAHAVEADSAKGLELPGVASDYRLQQEVAGKRLLILASAIPQLKPNSEIFLVPAPQKKPAQSQQEAFPSPPASESPRLQSANTTALVKQENISPPAVPLGTGIRKLSHGKARTTEASRASSQASGSGSSAKVPTVTAPQAPAVRPTKSASMQSTASTSSASSSNVSQSPTAAASNAPDDPSARLQFFQASARSNRKLADAIDRHSSVAQKRKRESIGNGLVFKFHAIALRLSGKLPLGLALPHAKGAFLDFDPNTRTVRDAQIQLAAVSNYTKTWVSSPQPEEIAIMHEAGRVCLPLEDLSGFQLPCQLMATVKTKGSTLIPHPTDLSVRFQQEVVKFQVTARPKTVITMLVIFDRLAEAFPDLHLSPANYYLTHGTGNFDVFNSELLSSYKSMFESGKTSFELHPMRPYTVNVLEDSRRQPTQVDRAITIGGLLRKFEKENGWTKGTRRILIKAANVNPPSWFDLDQNPDAEPFFRYAADGDEIALEPIEWVDGGAPEQKKVKMSPVSD